MDAKDDRAREIWNKGLGKNSPMPAKTPANTAPRSEAGPLERAIG
jgi:hypothetical protein